MSSPTETENAPAVDDSHSPSMSDGAEATSFGIIGGADGPRAGTAACMPSADAPGGDRRGRGRPPR